LGKLGGGVSVKKKRMHESERCDGDYPKSYFYVEMDIVLG